MPRILITGGAGFIASALAHRLASSSENEVVVVDNLSTGELKNLDLDAFKNLKFIKCDVNKNDDISGVFYTYHFDFVFHYAAYVGVQRTLNNPVNVLEDIDGIKNILNLSKNTGVKRVFYSSSSEVYGEPFEIPQNESTTPLNSRLPYAIVKNVGEAFLKAYHKEFGLSYTIFRFFNTYGPNQSNDFVVSKFIEAAVQNEDLTIYGDGNQTRTFCYISDNIDACVKVFEQNQFVNDVVNIGSNDEISIMQLAETILEVTGSDAKIRFLPALEEGDMRRRKPDISKMMGIMENRLTPLEVGLKRILESQKSSENVRD